MTIDEYVTLFCATRYATKRLSYAAGSVASEVCRLAPTMGESHRIGLAEDIEKELPQDLPDDIRAGWMRAIAALRDSSGAGRVTEEEESER